MNDTTYEIPSISSEQAPDAEPEHDPAVRDELLTLSEKGEIKYTANYIKKASQKSLEKIKRDYDRKQLVEANEFISESLISKFSELMNNLGMVDDPDGMGKDLGSNQLLKRDLNSTIGNITPYIPLIGLLCGAIIVGKHVISSRVNAGSTAEKQ